MNKPSCSCHLNWRPFVMILASIKAEMGLNTWTFLQRIKFHSLILYIPFYKWTYSIMLGLNHFSELNPILDKPSPNGCGWSISMKRGLLLNRGTSWFTTEMNSMFFKSDFFWIPSIYLSSDPQNWMWEASLSIYFIPEITSQFHHGQNIGF